MNNEPWDYPLFNHMSIEHGLTLLESEMVEIIRISLECERRRWEVLARLTDNPPWPPKDAKPGDVWGILRLCDDGFWREAKPAEKIIFEQKIFSV